MERGAARLAEGPSLSHVSAIIVTWDPFHKEKSTINRKILYMICHRAMINLDITTEINYSSMANHVQNLRLIVAFSL